MQEYAQRDPSACTKHIRQARTDWKEDFAEVLKCCR